MNDKRETNGVQSRNGRRPFLIALASVLALTFAGGWWTWRAHEGHRRVHSPGVYTAEGYGGFVPATPPVAPAVRQGAKAVPHRLAAASDPVQPAQDAYNAGRYGEAEVRAQRVVAGAAHSPSVSRHRQAAFARQVLAYSAARRRDLPLARVRFAALQTEASKLPDRGQEPAPPGQTAPTLEAEAAFQHAVCTGALGDAAGAEGEYRAFMARFPDSPLVHAAIVRVARLHGGNVPKADEAVWRKAQQVAQRHQETRMREASLCGPECLAEMLRRRGAAADVHGLAREMGTSERGTTLSALAGAAQKRGWHAEGLALTPKGLAAQRLPVIALIEPGHYVLVEAVTPSQVTVWDPDARGVGKSDRQTVPAARWQRLWAGTALALRPEQGPVRTAER